MKLYFTKTLKTVFIICFLFLGQVSHTQTLSQSPYARFGLGDIQYTTSPYLQALGGSSQAIADSNILNFNQPAALAALESGVTIFEAGINGRATRYDFTNISSVGRTAGFAYFGLAFPIIKSKWNMAIGLNPLSNVGYTLRDTFTDPVAGDVFLNYTGNGGYSSFSWTNGFKIGKNFSLGVTGKYLFGKVDYSSEVLFSGGQAEGDKNSLITNTNRIGGFDVETGLMYRKYFRKPKVKEGSTDKKVKSDSLHLTLGGTFKPLTKVSGDFSYLAQSFFGPIPSLLSSFTDTIAVNDRTEGLITLPMQYGAGITLSNSENKWLVTTEIVFTDWDNFRLFDVRDSVRSSFRASLGIQINPAPVSTTAKTSYLKKIRYRLGGSYSDGMLTINGDAVPEYEVNLGFGLPIQLRTYNKKPATSVLNFAVGIGRRGMPGVNPLVENYIKASVSFSLNDRWFRKLQYD